MPLIDSLSDQHGVESVCRELAIAPSTFYWHRQRNMHPEMRCDRDKRDNALCVEVQRVYDENKQVYGVRVMARNRNPSDSQSAQFSAQIK